LRKRGTDTVFRAEQEQLKRCVRGLKSLGWKVFSGPHQASAVSCIPGMDCEDAASALARQGIAVRAGLHCAPLAHESAGTLQTGTLRLSFGYDTKNADTEGFLRAASKLPPFGK